MIKSYVDPRWLWVPTGTARHDSVATAAPRRTTPHTFAASRFIQWPPRAPPNLSHSLSISIRPAGPTQWQHLAAYNINSAPKPPVIAGESRDRERNREMADSLADMVLGFFEEEWADGTSGSDVGCISAGDGEVAEAGCAAAEARAFWESQEQILQEALMRNGSTETRIRGNVEETVRELDGRGCVLREIAERLREKGYDSAVCRSKWRRSPDIPSGEHNYIDIIIGSRNGFKDPTRIIIEPTFKAEFEMARASPEYNSLVARLPEMFVGKTERLKSVVKIMCRAAKRSMKENKMHMGPWRKHEYMLSKWLGTCERLSKLMPPVPAREASTAAAARQPRPRASMLTFDLLRTAVKVV